ncbi:MAG: hypothetical protein WBD13_18960 [Burkholderiaceae bacterium]
MFILKAILASVAVTVSTMVAAYTARVFVPILFGMDKFLVLLFATALVAVMVVGATVLTSFALRVLNWSWLVRHITQCAALYLVVGAGACVAVNELLGPLPLFEDMPVYLFWWSIGATMGIMGNLLGQGMIEVWTESRSNTALNSTFASGREPGLRPEPSAASKCELT